jgi:ferredoxin-like protein FixX
MGKKLLIDLLKLRDFDDLPAEGIFKEKGYERSFKSIRELAAFQFTCRKCEIAPCITSCPAEALKKDAGGVISRSMYKCVRCKSCIVTCPFGTLTDNLFAVRLPGRRFIYLDSDAAMTEFASFFPAGVVSWVEAAEDAGNNIHALGDNVLIIEKTWK